MEQILNAILSEVKGINTRLDKLEKRFDNLEGRFDNLEGRFDNLEGRFDNLEGRFDNLEGRFDNLEGRFDNLESDVSSLKSDMSSVKSQVQENTRILKALEHKSDVHKAEIDRLNYTVAELCGNFVELKDDVAKGREAYNFLQELKGFSPSR